MPNSLNSDVRSISVRIERSTVMIQIHCEQMPGSLFLTWNEAEELACLLQDHLHDTPRQEYLLADMRLIRPEAEHLMNMVEERLWVNPPNDEARRSDYEDKANWIVEGF